MPQHLNEYLCYICIILIIIMLLMVHSPWFFIISMKIFFGGEKTEEWKKIKADWNFVSTYSLGSKIHMDGWSYIVDTHPGTVGACAVVDKLSVRHARLQNHHVPKDWSSPSAPLELPWQSCANPAINTMTNPNPLRASHRHRFAIL